MKKGAVFFDRDDTLVKDTGYMHKIADFQWMDGALVALKQVCDAGIAVFIVTNQGGIGKGLFTCQQMQVFHNHLLEEAEKADITITDIAYCPHHPEAVTAEMATPCTCRKPEPGMLRQLAHKWDIDLGQSVMIGDRLSDIEAGRRAGCSALRLTEDRNLPDLVTAAIDIIKKA